MTKDTRTPMVFGDGKAHNGTDAWFWGDLTGRGPADEPNIFPLVLQMGVWSGELTLEQARYLRDLRGDEWWSNIDFRVIRRYLAEQEGKPAPNEPAPRAKRAKQARPTLPARQADELIAGLRQATAALLEAEKRYNPDQPRYPAGDPRGGQWRPEGGAGETTAEATQPAPGQGLFSLEGDPYLSAANAQQLLDNAEGSLLHAIPLNMAEIEQMTTMPGFRSQTKIRNGYAPGGDLAVELKTNYYDAETGDWAGEQSVTFYWPDSGWIEDQFYSGESTISDGMIALLDQEAYVHADLMRFAPKYQDRGLQAELVGRQMDLAIAKKIAEVHTDADITIGRYVWATRGFQYAEPSRAGRASRDFVSWCGEQGIKLDSYPDFKTPQDVIKFTVPGVTMPHYRIRNADAKPVDYEVGKAFMLDTNGHGDWNAVLDLRPYHWLRS